MGLPEQEVPKFLNLLVSPNTARADLRVVYVDSQQLEPKLDVWLHKSLSGIHTFDFNTDYVQKIRTHMKGGNSDLARMRDEILSQMAWASIFEYQSRNTKIESTLTLLRNTLKRLNLVVKPSDKGGRTVVMSDSYYRRACLNLLNVSTDYLTTTESAYWKCEATAKKLITIHKDALKLLLGAKEMAMRSRIFRVGYFYGLPKVHKSLEAPPMRPVVSQINHPTALFSAAINKFTLKWILNEESICQSSLDFTRTLDSLPRGAFKNVKFATIDVNSLYTSIPLATGIKRFYEYVEGKCRSRNDFEILNFIRKTLPFSQYNNVFLYGDTYYRQKKGVAMGCPLGPTFANIYLLELDRKIMELSKCCLYRRYIDDIFIILPEELVDFDTFESDLNKLDPDIKFKLEEFGSSVKFLDLDVFLDNGSVKYQLYEKEISCIYRYVEKESLHPPSTTIGIPLGAMKRIRNLTPNRLTSHLLFENIFLRRLANVGYNEVRMMDLWWKLIINPVVREHDSPDSHISAHERRIITPYVKSWKVNNMGIRRLNDLISKHPDKDMKKVTLTFSCNRSLKSKLVRSRYIASGSG